MDLSLLENFQKLVTSSLQSIIEDLKTQFENQKEELGDRIVDLTIKTKEQEKQINELTSKIEENDFNEGNYTRVSIISNLNKQIKQLQNENDDLRNLLSKNIPLNPSLARSNSPTNSEENSGSVINEEVAEDDIVNEEEVVNEEENDTEEDTLEEIEHKNKVYYLVDDKLYTKKKDGSQGKCVGKMVDGKPKLNKKKKKTEN